MRQAAPGRLAEDVPATPWSAFLGCESIGRDAVSDRDLDAARTAGDGSATPPFGPPPPAREGGTLPLSLAQESLWIEERRRRDAGTHSLPLAVEIGGRLQLSALAASLAAVVQRHEALRTVVHCEHGQPVARLAGCAPAIAIPAVDLGALPPARRRDEVARLGEREAERPFDLARHPLLRALVVRLDTEEHIALLALHRIAADGWSLAVLLGEVSRLYRAFSGGAAANLPPLAMQYADFAAWQRARLRGPTLSALLRYWRAQFASLPPRLELPVDRPRRELGRRPRARLAVELGEPLTRAVEEGARRHGTMPFMVLGAGFAAWLGRLSGQDELVIGVPVANRRRPELEGLIGCFANTLALRVGLGGEPTVAELIRRVHESAMRAFAHQDLPFDQLAEGLALERGPARPPLVDVLFSLQELPAATPSPPGLRLRARQPPGGRAWFDLALGLARQDGTFAGACEYDSDLFDQVTVARWADHLLRLLGAATGDPGLRLAELPLLGPAERQQLLYEWNDRSGPPDSELRVELLLAAQAARTPDAVALSSADGQLTYGELERRAGRLARRLRALGIGPEIPVAVCLPRSSAAVEAMFGVWQAGGVYLPVDPAYPAERLRFMVEDARAGAVLVRGDGPELAWPSGLPRLTPGDWSADGGTGPSRRTDPEWTDGGRPAPSRAAEPERTDGGRPAPPRREEPGWTGAALLPDQLAYVIYTSGSTGVPKGVAVSHRAATTHFLAIRAAYGLGPGDRELLFASLSFDASLNQVVPVLASGARIELRPPGVWEPAELLARVAAERLTVVNLPTAFWHELAGVEPAPPDAPASALRLVIAGGDRMRAGALAAWWRSPCGQARLINAYGPTETVVTACVAEVPAGRLPARVPIGRGGFGGRSLHVLDRHGTPAPIGVAGELAIGGRTQARGYLHRPELTAERFVPDPFGRPGSRLYRTGDLARLLAGGAIDFIGRGDAQIKVRGFRVEPGEIEARLQEHPAVAAAVVALREDRLAAYLVARRRPAPEAAELRDFLSCRLPAFMVPAAFVWLEALPLSPAGKVDRRALPAPSEEGATGGAAVLGGAPGSTTGRLGAIWEEVLGRVVTSGEDDFFALGGDSLLALRLQARVRQDFAVELPLRDLFAAPTLAGLAHRIEEWQRQDQQWAAQPLAPRAG